MSVIVPQRELLKGFNTPKSLKGNSSSVEEGDLDLSRFTLVASGGTIDSEWDPSIDSARPSERSILPTYLGHDVRLRMPVDFVEVCMKDSRELIEAEKTAVKAEILGSRNQCAMATSGTYWAPDMANELVKSDDWASVSDYLRAIVIGAAVPLKGFVKSDGGFNLGMGLAAFEAMKPGEAAVCMNGRLIEAGEVIKNTNATVFTPSHSRFNKWHSFDELTVITAGGSIDFELDGIDGLRPREFSAVPDYLRGMNNHQRILHAPDSIMKDSRDLKGGEIEKIVKRVKASSTDRVLITMGIYDIDRVKEALEATDIPQNKVVALTGSRLPLSLCERSDAPFQLGYSIGKLASSEPGVYRTLSGLTLGEKDSVLDLYTKAELKKIKKQRKNNSKKKKSK